MASNTQSTNRIPTDQRLFILASSVTLNPAFGRAVFWSEGDGKRLAEEFVRTHPGYTRLEELLPQTTMGKVLLGELTARGRQWDTVKEVWWELSRRLARVAAGAVHVFGPPRLIMDGPLSAHRSKFSPDHHVDTVFEKVELPELEENPKVTQIFYNGRIFT